MFKACLPSHEYLALLLWQIRHFLGVPFPQLWRTRGWHARVQIARNSSQSPLAHATPHETSGPRKPHTEQRRSWERTEASAFRGWSVVEGDMPWQSVAECDILPPSSHFMSHSRSPEVVKSWLLFIVLISLASLASLREDSMRRRKRGSRAISLNM